MNKLTLTARYLVGILFIISGLIKVNDPVGTQIKLEEYFEVFATDFSEVFLYLVPYALFLSVFLSVLEVVLGVALLLRFKMKLTTSVLLVMILFFTGLTFFSAYTGKVTDCGCFGDALKLTPWQSFIKDLVLLVFIVILFVNSRRIEHFDKKKPAPALWVAATAVLCTALAWYAIEHLPFIDFRAYKKGNNIASLMEPSEDYRYSYIMMRGGVEYELDQYPDAQEGYEYKEIKLLNPEAQPVITDFGVWSDEGDFTQQALEGAKLLVVVHAVQKADTGQMDEINTLVSGLGNTVESWAITSSDAYSFDAFRHEHQLAIPYFFGDATLLKTMIRSNPGLILLKDGTVIEKWHHNDVPSADEVKALLK
jgi:uncharacterized membrane protein YphA (DoxX/SURF4 family)